MLSLGPALSKRARDHPQAPFLELGCGETSHLVLDYVRALCRPITFVDIKTPSKKVKGADYLTADAHDVPSTLYDGGLILIKWMLCHLKDADVVKLLSKLAENAREILVVDSACVLPSVEPGFIERTYEGWLKLFKAANVSHDEELRWTPKGLAP